MAAREWLSRGKGINLYINQLKESKERDFDERNTSDRISKRYAALNKEIEHQIECLEKVRFEIITTLEKVRDNVLSALLLGYYINGKTSAEMAEALNYTQRHVARLHGKALNEIKSIIGCD